MRQHEVKIRESHSNIQQEYLPILANISQGSNPYTLRREI